MNRLPMERLGKVVRGGVSPWINKAHIKCISYHSSDLPGNSTNKDVHCEHTGEMGAQKHLRESCYHHIKYFVTDSLVTLMRK